MTPTLRIFIAFLPRKAGTLPARPPYSLPPGRACGSAGWRPRPPDGRCSGLEQAGQPMASRRLAGQAERGLDRATGEDPPVGGAVDELDALAPAGELHGVLANHVAGTQAGIARLGARSAGADAGAERQCGAGGRVLLAAVVQLDDVAVPAVERRGGAFRQRLQHRDTDA